MLDILNIDLIEKIYNYLDINDKFNFIFFVTKIVTN